MKYLAPMAVVLGALAVAVGVLTILTLQPHAEPIETPGLSRTVWVAGVARADDSRAIAAFDALSSRLPGGVTGVPFVGEIEPAAERLGFPPETTRALAEGALDLLVATVDRSGRVRGRYGFSAGELDSGDGLEAVLADARFLHWLAGRPLLHAVLNAATALMLTTGFLLIRRRRIVGKVHFHEVQKHKERA